MKGGEGNRRKEREAGETRKLENKMSTYVLLYRVLGVESALYL